MTRIGDAPIPAVELHPLGPDSPIAGWPWRPVFALERQSVAAYTWDDPDDAVTWDAAGDVYVWDDPFTATDLIDVTCDWQAFDVEFGPPDEHGLYPALTASLSLDNRTGRYAQYDDDGRLTYWAPGRRLAVFARRLDDGTDWWIADLHVEAWRDVGDTVELEAGDGFVLLARELGGEWTPGAAGQKPLARVGSIVAAAGYTGAYTGDQGDVTLAAPANDRSPLEELQVTALSDGGIIAGDADGRIRYRDRTWPAGRLDQTRQDRFTDTECDAGAHVVWDAELTTADDALATTVRLVNTAGLTAVAAGPALNGRSYPYTHPDEDLWQNQAQGDTLATALHAARSTPVVAVESFDLHLLDPTQDLWQAGIDVRLGDRIGFVHGFPTEQGFPGLLDVVGIVSRIGHRITPDAWIVTLGTTRTVDTNPIHRWDVAPYGWDDPDPTNVWR